MIKITLKDGTSIEMDKYEKGVFYDIKHLATKGVQAPIMLMRLKKCKMCDELLPSHKKLYCGKICFKKAKARYMKNWHKVREPQLRVERASQTQNVPITVS